MLGYMGIYKTLKTIETLALHERVPKLVTVVLYIPILHSIPYNNIYSHIYIYKGCYIVEQEFPCLLIFTHSQTLTHSHSRTLTHTHTLTHSHTHTRTHAHMHTRTHAHMHTHTHTHTHTRTHAHIYKHI